MLNLHIYIYVLFLDKVFYLYDGSVPSEGRIEVSMDGIQGRICAESFDFYNASVICKSLGL